jgi:hypothetical protein
MKKVVLLLVAALALAAEVRAWTWPEIKLAVADNDKKIKALTADADVQLQLSTGTYQAHYRIFYKYPYEVKLVNKADERVFYYRNKDTTINQSGEDFLIGTLYSSLQVDNTGLIFNPLIQVFHMDTADIHQSGDSVTAILKNVPAVSNPNSKSDYGLLFQSSTATVTHVEISGLASGVLDYQYSTVDSVRIPTVVVMHTQSVFTRLLANVKLNSNVDDSITVSIAPRPAVSSPQSRTPSLFRYDLRGRTLDPLRMREPFVTFPRTP